MNTTKEEYETL